MEFNELIAEFATRHNVANLVAEDGVAALDIDGIIVSIISRGDVLSVSADIGEPPTEGAAVFANLLLEANLQSDAVFAKTPESETYVVVRRFSLLMLDVATFDAALEEFVNHVETWRQLLSDFRPVAKASAERSSAGSQQLGASGFMQV